MLTPLSVVCILAVFLVVEAEDIPECVGVSQDKLDELEKLMISDDIHDQMEGEFSEVWGPKVVVEGDDAACVHLSAKKVDDKELSQTCTLKGKWFGENMVKTSTIEKVGNGIYVVKARGEFKAKFYALYSKNNVHAFAGCLLFSPPDEDHRHKLPLWTGVTVRGEDLKTPLDPKVKEAVDEAVKKILGASDLLGEISQYANPC